jgi:hypothetical protein
MDRTSFRVAENVQPRGRGQDRRGKGGGYRSGYPGGRIGGCIGPVHHYNCKDIGHITQNFPLPRRLWCNHCRTTGHTTEYCPNLIERWEARNRQRNANLVNSEPRTPSREAGSTINVFTTGGTRIRVDKYSIKPA